MDTEIQPATTGDVYADDALQLSRLACNGCRKRKQKCDRVLPACQTCQRIGTECEYNRDRRKPGMKPGALEGIQQRLNRLEQAIAAGEGGHGAPSPQTTATPPIDTEKEPSNVSTELQGVLSLLVKELHELNEGRQVAGTRCEVSPARLSQPPRRPDYDNGPRKRRRDSTSNTSTTDQSLSLPTGAQLQEIVGTYFDLIHPWIPMIHERRFRTRLASNAERSKINIILHAMMVSTHRYCRIPPQYNVEQARHWIIASGISSFSIEGIQALIIVAYNDIGNGDGSRGWSVVGALTRAVEYLQLTTEPDTNDSRSLLPPNNCFVPPISDGFVETEERRRVFWTIFNLDRFCSVSMGWNISLTSDDIFRRLPCDVHLWNRNEEHPMNNEVITPYFNIWDGSAARMGKMVAFIPSYLPATSGARGHESSEAPLETGVLRAEQTASTTPSMIGAFAYRVEATESLSRVTTHFLQQKVDFRKTQEFGSWLTRFKELDLRLMHWKLLLPQKWKANISRQTVKMDPNLTLAHLSHNASIILLHQVIAYPKREWTFSVKVPSESSAETCQAAAIEISSITDHYLRTCPPRLPLCNQFSFCVYIAARVLLLQWRHYNKPHVAAEFDTLVKCLSNIGQRWMGLDSSCQDCLSMRYVRELVELQLSCINNDLTRIDPLGYTKGVSHCSSSYGDGASNAAVDIVDNISPNNAPPSVANTSVSASSINLDNVFEEHQSLDMDRVITFQDSIFGADYEGFGWE